MAPPWSEIVKYDLNTGDIVWRVPAGVQQAPPEYKIPDDTGVQFPRNAPLVTAGGLLFLALCSKESAVAIPLLAAAVALFGLAPVAPRAVAAQLLAVALYVALRVAVLGTLLGTHVPASADSSDVDNPLAGRPAVERVLTMGSLAPRIAEMLVAPVRLSADYSYDQVPVVVSPSGRSVLGLLLPVMASPTRIRCFPGRWS